MNKHTQLSITTALALIIGFGAGWFMHTPPAPMTHTMPDGTTMADTQANSDMGAIMHDMNAGLVGKTGDDFDAAFIAEMITHHQGAIDMANTAKTSAKHAEIKQMADAIISAQTKEIDQMREWNRMWFNAEVQEY
jgi:uncharacterized protein (DUF305 family)